MASRSKPRRSSAAAPKHGYPRPQLMRQQWESLNGKWEFAIDESATWTSPKQVDFDRRIVVPFAPETPASGVEETGFYEAVWYRRTIPSPRVKKGERVILHFGAVDYTATIWVNDSLAATHEGGYTPFSADITDLLTGGEATIVVRAHDDPQDLAKPRGKQDWLKDPHSIWYYRTTGIWQTVWMEVVPATRIDSLRWTARVEDWSIDLQASIAGPRDAAKRLRVRLLSRGNVLTDDTYSIQNGEVSRRIGLGDGGIDDYRNALLWWPWAPNLIDAELELLDDDGVIDRVQSYTAMRSVAAEKEQFSLNGRPMMLRLVLDQGYWRESGLTSPSDDALRRDVELVKELGFNGVRKHQKIEDPRFLYWADRLGLMVWEEMPSPYRFSPRAIERFTNQWLEAMRRDVSHPCIICWVPFNESWGVPDLPNVAEQREFLRGVYHLSRAFDPTRPVIGNDGWEMVETDIVAVHDYERVPDRLLERYDARNLANTLERERPGHRKLLLDGCPHDQSPVMLTEFGGIAFHKDTKHTWGYKRATTAKQFEKQYADLLSTVRKLPAFAGFCYTQFTDTYQEANGLLYMDRTPKFPIGRIRKATSGE